MGNASGIATALGAAAPGIAQGVGQAVDSYKGFKADQQLDADTAKMTGGSQVGLADANHPVWGILNNLTGNPGNAPLPGGGAPAPQPAIPAPQMAAPSPVQMGQMGADAAPRGFQNGGVVRLNNGSPVIAPSFERGPALPTGPNNTITAPTSPTMQGMAGYEDGGTVSASDGYKKSTGWDLAKQAVKEVGHAIFGDGAAARAGETIASRPAQVDKVSGYANGGLVGDREGLGQGITPASTDGQILTFDAGGVVPDGFHEQQGISGVPMSGRGAALVEGIQAGQNIGHNLQQAWHDRQAREAAAQYAGNVAGIDVNNPNNGQQDQETMLGHARDAVEGFFHHMNNVSLDDNHKPNGAQAVSAPATGAAPSGPALPAGGSPVPPNGSSPPAGGPAPGAALPAGAAPLAPQPGGGPPQPAGAAPSGAPPVAGGPPQQPNAQQQATQIATKSVAANNEVRQGIPDKTPEESSLPHSMTPDQWNHMNMLKQKAVMAAARAGEDPAKVYESLTAMQNAHFQGQILKQLGTANVAFQNGDMKSVQQALKNVNYYLPNGQDIQFKTATAQDAATDPSVKPGDLMYRNPFFGMYGHEKDPEYTKIDAQHIQSLGAAALDPRTVQEAQLKSYQAQQEAQSNRIKAQGEFMTGQGRQMTGAAAVQNAGSRATMLDVDRRLKIATGNREQAEANWYNTRQPSATSGQPKVTAASLLAAQRDVAATTDKLSQGIALAAPTNPDGSINLNAGRQVPDPTRVPNYLKGITPEQRDNIVTIGSQVKGANPTMSSTEAIEMAARVTHYQTQQSVHVNPTTGKKEKDVVYDPKEGTLHVWVGNGWKNAYLRPNVADEPSGAGGETPPSGGGGGALNTEEAPSGPDAFQ